MLKARIRLRIERDFAHLPLEAEPRDQHGSDAGERNQHEPSADEQDEPQEKDQEGDVYGKNDSGRGEEVAHHLIVGDAAGERARAPLPIGHRKVHDLLEQLLRKLGVELAGDLVDQPGTGDA